MLEPTELDLDALEPIPAGRVASSLYLVSDGKFLEYPLIYKLVSNLMPETCPATVRVVRIPFSDVRSEGAIWVDPSRPYIYVRSDEPDFYQVEGFDSQLFAWLGRLCLANTSRQGAYALSREEKGLRFLEEGFGQYLLTRPEQAAVGGRPDATAQFLSFAAQVELAHRFELDDFWERLPDRAEALNPAVALHPRRQEASLLAGAFVRSLIEEQGLGMPGFLQLWQMLAANPFRRNAQGYAIPRNTVEPVLSGFLTVASGGKLKGLGGAWSRFAETLQARSFERPTVDLWLEGARLVMAFSRPMLQERVDITLDGVQIGPERLKAGLGSWSNDRTVVLELTEAKSQMGFERVEQVQVNWGRIWQWFRAQDGVPAEGGMLRLSPPQQADNRPLR